MGHVLKSFGCGFFTFLMTFVTCLFFLPTTGQETELTVDDRVLVAFKGENLNVSYKLAKPANQSQDNLTCFDPHNVPVYRFELKATTESEYIQRSFFLQNVTLSGEYHCRYKNAEATWFVRVSDGGYKENWDYSKSEVIVVSVVTGLLLIVSVGGSIYVFRGNWACCTFQNETQNSDVKQEETGVTTNGESAQSTSFYASLDARPRSVYDVLDHSASVSAGAQRGPAKSKTRNKKEAQKTGKQTPQKQDEGIFECVYENF